MLPMSRSSPTARAPLMVAIRSTSSGAGAAAPPTANRCSSGAVRAQGDIDAAGDIARHRGDAVAEVEVADRVVGDGDAGFGKERDLTLSDSHGVGGQDARSERPEARQPANSPIDAIATSDHR